MWPNAGGGGNSLGESEGLKRVVAKLLVRDPSKRARVGDVWEDEWMKGVGAPSPPTIPPDEEGEGEEEEEDGLLVDGQEIGPGHVVRQEH